MFHHKTPQELVERLGHRIEKNGGLYGPLLSRIALLEPLDFTVEDPSQTLFQTTWAFGNTEIDTVEDHTIVTKNLETRTCERTFEVNRKLGGITMRAVFSIAIPGGLFFDATLSCDGRGKPWYAAHQGVDVPNEAPKKHAVSTLAWPTHLVNEVDVGILTTVPLKLQQARAVLVNYNGDSPYIESMLRKSAAVEEAAAIRLGLPVTTLLQ